MMGAIINIGAVVGEGTMIDMGAVLGGRAVVGKHCHVGAGVDDPLYLGERHKRVDEDRYNAFIDNFVTTVEKLFPFTL